MTSVVVMILEVGAMSIVADAMMIPKIAVTTISSIRVKPLTVVFFTAHPPLKS
jgi:hypothetical protein